MNEEENQRKQANKKGATARFGTDWGSGAFRKDSRPPHRLSFSLLAGLLGDAETLAQALTEKAAAATDLEALLQQSLALEVRLLASPGGSATKRGYTVVFLVLSIPNRGVTAHAPMAFAECPLIRERSHSHALPSRFFFASHAGAPEACRCERQNARCYPRGRCAWHNTFEEGEERRGGGCVCMKSKLRRRMDVTGKQCEAS